MRKRIDIVNVRRAGAGEIADIRRIRSLAIVDVVHQLRNEIVEIEIPLAMGMARQVLRHVIQRDGKIRPMIELKAAKKVLIGLPRPTVLRDDQPRHGFQNFRRPQNRTTGQIVSADMALV